MHYDRALKLKQLPWSVFLNLLDSISQNGDIYSNDASSPKKNLGFKFQLNRSNRLDTRRYYVFYNCLYLPASCKLYMVTITSNIYINIFQTVHFSAVKFTRGNEKNMTFLLLIPKSQESLKKIWSNQTGLLICTNIYILNDILMYSCANYKHDSYNFCKDKE